MMMSQELFVDRLSKRLSQVVPESEVKLIGQPVHTWGFATFFFQDRKLHRAQQGAKSNKARSEK